MSADRPLRKTRGGSLLGNDWEEKTRQKIQASQIANRLISFIEGKIKLEAPQVTAALGLLKKVLPDLTSIEHSGEVGTNYVARLPAHVANIEEWQKNTDATLQ